MGTRGDNHLVVERSKLLNFMMSSTDKGRYSKNWCSGRLRFIRPTSVSRTLV